MKINSLNTAQYAVQSKAQCKNQNPSFGKLLKFNNTLGNHIMDIERCNPDWIYLERTKQSYAKLIDKIATSEQIAKYVKENDVALKLTQSPEDGLNTYVSFNIIDPVFSKKVENIINKIKVLGENICGDTSIMLWSRASHGFPLNDAMDDIAEQVQDLDIEKEKQNIMNYYNEKLQKAEGRAEYSNNVRIEKERQRQEAEDRLNNAADTFRSWM